jgi:hypothetical protein
VHLLVRSGRGCSGGTGSGDRDVAVGKLALAELTSPFFGRARPIQPGDVHRLLLAVPLDPRRNGHCVILELLPALFAVCLS